VLFGSTSIEAVGGTLSMLLISMVILSPCSSPSVRRISTSPFSSTTMPVSGSYFSQFSPPSLEYSISYFPSGSTDSSSSIFTITSWLVGPLSDTSILTFGSSPVSSFLLVIKSGIPLVLLLICLVVSFPASSLTVTLIS